MNCIKILVGSWWIASCVGLLLALAVGEWKAYALGLGFLACSSAVGLVAMRD